MCNFSNQLSSNQMITLRLRYFCLYSILYIFQAFGYNYSSHENVVNWFERMKKTLEPHGYKEIDETGAQILASFLKKE